jgi:hypothetical protein
MIFLLFALLVSGCGGSDDEALSKSAFVKQGNAICQEATEEREKMLADFVKTADPNGNKEELQEKAVTQILPIYEEAAVKIEDLGAPAGDEAKVEAIVDAMEEAAAKVEANPQSAAVGDLPFRKANKAAESYGLKACAI